MAAQAGQTTVIGKVTASDGGAPLADARVVVVGTAIQVVTNTQGEYRIQTAQPGRVQLTVYRIGYQSKVDTVTAPAGGTATLNFVLQQSRTQLSEIVVTGTTGNQQRRAQPAVITSVSVEDLMKDSPARNVNQLLQSRVPSLSVSTTSGTSGSSRRVNIRGAASVNLSNQPLIFIDGVRLNEGQPALAAGGQLADRLNNINPDDIESIEVVKGPAAATLYGADASAGVIQIITKKGRIGTTRFSQTLSADVGQAKQIQLPPDNYARCTAALVAPTSINPLCVNQPVGTLVSDNPLVREGAFRTGDIRKVNYSARGGGQNYGYFVSLGANQEQGTLPNNQFDRYSLRTNFNFVPDRRVTVNASLSLGQNRLNAPQNDNNVYGFLGGGLLGNPTTRTNNGTGSNGWFGIGRDLAAITAIETGLLTRQNVVGITVNYLPTSWFTNKLTIGGDILSEESSLYFPKNSRGSYQGNANLGQNDQDRRSVERYTVDYLANAKRAFGENDQWGMNASAGVQLISTRNDLLSFTGFGFVTNSNNSPTSASTRSGSGGRTEIRQRGYVSEIQLSSSDKRFLNAGVRVDEFSVFGSEVKPAVLPKIGASWVISEEGFFSPARRVFGQLRLRAAYGQTGRAPGAGAALTTLNATPSVVNTSVESGAVPANPGNSNLKPERGSELELGLDASFLDDRLSIELTRFDKRTKDLILAQPLPPSLGFTANPLVNIGEVRNSGIEMSISATPIRSRIVDWDILLGGATLKNELTDLGGVPAFGTLNRFTQGYQLGSFVSKAIESVDLATGVVRVADTLSVIGNIFPTFEGTLSSTFTFYKQLRITGQFDTKRNFSVYNNTAFFKETQLVSSNLRLDTLTQSRLLRLRKYGNPTTGQPAFVQKNGAATTVNEVRDAFVQPGDFVRLRELSATWTVPARFLGRIGGRVNAASLSLAVQNVKLWKNKGFEGPDPEVISTANNQFVRDDFLTIASPRTTVVRFNITF
ncbi:MAG: SusC/RagA family TonB-linked outer membrane protein [Gemmatimonadota bacterium]